MISISLTFLIWKTYFFSKGRSRRGGKAQAITTEHHYHVELFYTVVDMQLQELNDRFIETNTQLLFLHGLFESNQFILCF